jgi:ABC-type lipoprotein export system ATPase subunit
MEIAGTLVSLENISKAFGERVVLKNINLRINEGDFLTIIGRSGAGKSTLLNCIGLLDAPTSGNYFYKGEDILKKRRSKQATLRAGEIGFIFQSYGLMEELTVEENILLSPKYANQSFNKELFEKLEYYMEKFKLKEIRKSKAKFLSGGEKQRVAIARAMIKKPSLIVADEPTGNLDGENSHIILEEFKQLKKEGTAVVVVSHDVQLFSQYGKCLELSDGVLKNVIETD